MTRLAEAFDGVERELVPEEDFHIGPFILIDEFEEEETVEEATQWESETLVPVTSEDVYSVTIPGFLTEHGWGAFSMSMAGLCLILKVQRHQYQRNYYPEGGGPVERRFTFQGSPQEGGDGYQGGRL